MKRKLVIAGIILALALIVAIGAIIGITSRTHHDLSLTFEKDSDFSPYFYDAAVLWLTNRSNRNYVLTSDNLTIGAQGQPGLFGGFRQTHLVNCAFSDYTPQGWSNWGTYQRQQPPNYSLISLPAHSGIWIRAPLSLDGRKRKVAVVCQAAVGVPSYLLGPTGRRILLRMPRRVIAWYFDPKPREIWCEEELQLPSAAR
jgi:hypothetical protein